MNGRMALALQLHDAFGADVLTSYSLMHDWRRRCLQQHAGDEERARSSVVGVNPAAALAKLEA
jgi:hypothetical protein